MSAGRGSVFEVRVRRVVIGAAAALVAVPPTLVGIEAVSGRSGAEAPAPVEHVVVETRCVGGRIVQGIDIGRTDGALLARSTEVAC